MKDALKDHLVVVGWGVIEACIVLQALLKGPMLTMVDLFFLFVVSMLASMILVDVRKVVLGLFGSLLLSFLILFFCLTLPVTLGLVREVFWDMVSTTAITMIFRGVFPFAIIACFLGGLFGGIVGERWRFR